MYNNHKFKEDFLDYIPLLDSFYVKLRLLFMTDDSGRENREDSISGTRATVQGATSVWCGTANSRIATQESVSN